MNQNRARPKQGQQERGGAVSVGGGGGSLLIPHTIPVNRTIWYAWKNTGVSV